MVEAIREGDIPGVQLRCRQALDLPAEEAWRWLVEPGRLARWLADEAAAEAVAGGGLSLAGVFEEEPYQERGRTVEVVEHRRWVLALERPEAGWGTALKLTLELHPTPGGCEVDILQEGFQRLPLSAGLTIWESYRRRWRQALARLSEAVAG